MNKSKQKILVVDDDEFIRDYIITKLSKHGYLADFAASGEEALQKLGDASYNLFISDINMPGLNGVELLKKLDLKNNPYGAIVITAYGEVDSARKAMELGAYSYLVKPFRSEDLLDQVEKSLTMIALKRERMRFVNITKKEFGESSLELQNQIDITNFAQKISTLIHGEIDKENIFNIIKKESEISEKYDTFVLTITDDNLYFIITESSLPPPHTYIKELFDANDTKTRCTFRMWGDFKIDLNKSIILGSVIKERKSLQVKIKDVLDELLSESQSAKVSKVYGLGKKYSVLTPLIKRNNILGIFIVCLNDLSGNNIQPVQNLARNISVALELSDEHAERLRIEKILAEKEAYSSDLLNGASAGILIVDPHSHQIIDVNPSAANLLGLPKEQIVGHLCHNYICSDTNGKCPISDFGQKIDQRECTLLKSDKTQIPIIKTVVPSILNGRVCFIETFLDITKRKKAENEMIKSQKQLRDLALHLQSVREKERTMIAREIHDELGQVLTALKMDVSWLKSRLSHDQEALHKKADVMNELIDSSIQMVKRISTQLRPGILDDMGLTAAIEWQVEELRNRTGMTCDIKTDFLEEGLNDNTKTTIFRILQEALTNILRHAKATRITISVFETDASLHMLISDNGKGISEQQLSKHYSFGLVGIKERALSLGGTAEVTGVEKQGTTVSVSIPLGKERIENTVIQQ